MKISAQQVQSVAHLARLALTEQEAEKLSTQLSALVENFQQLDELDTEQVEPTAHAVPLLCPQRSDVVQPSIPRKAVLGQAPRQEDGHFVVPKVIE